VASQGPAAADTGHGTCFCCRARQRAAAPGAAPASSRTGPGATGRSGASAGAARRRSGASRTAAPGAAARPARRSGPAPRRSPPGCPAPGGAARVAGAGAGGRRRKQVRAAGAAYCSGPQLCELPNRRTPFLGRPDRWGASPWRGSLRVHKVHERLLSEGPGAPEQDRGGGNAAAARPPYAGAV